MDDRSTPPCLEGQVGDSSPTGRGSTLPLATRRALLASGAALGGLAVLGSAATKVDHAFARDAKDVVAGTVDRVDPSGALHLRKGADAEVIEFPEGTTFWRDHPVELTAFAAGDLVAAEGEHVRGGFVATYLTSVYVVATGRITRREDDRLQTTGGTMRLTRDSFPHGGHGLARKALADLADGDEVVAIGRNDPDLGFLAIGVGVRAGG